MKLCALFFTLLVLGAWSQSFSGVWTDSEFANGDFYICVETDNSFYGSYAEVGLAVGEVSGNVVNGDWYEGGGSQRPEKVTGKFQLTLSNDGASFTGWYNYGPGTANQDWSETRISATMPASSECALLSTNRYSTGVWTSESAGIYDWAFCSQGTTYTSSFDNRASNSQGFEEGILYDTSRITSGYYQENIPTGRGTSLSFVLRDGTMGNYYWYSPNPTTNPSYTTGEHATDIYQYQGTAVGSQCDRYEYIVGRGNTNSIPDNTNSIPDNTNSKPDNTNSIPDNTNSKPDNTNSKPDNTNSKPDTNSNTSVNTVSNTSSSASVMGVSFVLAVVLLGLF